MTVMQLRKFTREGITRVEGELEKIKARQPANLISLLEDPKLTKEISSGCSIELVKFKNRMACGKYFYEFFEKNSDSKLENPEKDKGLWTWLAIAWSEDLLRKKGDPVGQMARWILNLDWNRYYRHLLAGPYFVYKAHADNPNRALALLCNNLTSPGEVYEQVIRYRNIIRFPGLVGAVTSLYYDPKTDSLKLGSASKSYGSARRFSSVIRQFELTYDIYGMLSDQILDLLPSEFDKFK